MKVEPPPPVNSVFSHDGSGGGSGTVKEESCTTDANSRTEPHEGTKSSGGSPEAGRVRNKDVSKGDSVPSAPSAQGRTSTDSIDDKDVSPAQQTNGRSTDVEKGAHDCTAAASAESTDLRTDQACDKPVGGGGGVPAKPHADTTSSSVTDSSALKTCKPDAAEARSVTPDAKPVRNGGLEELTAATGADD